MLRPPVLVLLLLLLSPTFIPSARRALFHSIVSALIAALRVGSFTHRLVDLLNILPASSHVPPTASATVGSSRTIVSADNCLAVASSMRPTALPTLTHRPVLGFLIWPFRHP